MDSSAFQRVMRLISEWVSRSDGNDQGDRLSGVRVPKGSSPRLRDAAASVAEPEPELFADAVGSSGGRRL